MSAAKSNGPSAEHTLVERCRQMGFPAWYWNGSRAHLVEPADVDPALEWLRAAKLRTWVESRLRLGAPAAGNTELFPGCWLLPVGGGDTGTGLGRCALAMVLEPRALETSAFADVCVSAGLDPAEASAAVKPIAVHGPADLDRLSQVLAWMHEDLSQRTEDEQALRMFSRQLVDSYEQVSLVYRVAKSMSGVDDPREFVRTTCQELYDTLEFDWIAAWIANMPGSGFTSESIVAAGRVPVRPTQFGPRAAELAARIDPEQRTRVITEDAEPLARIVGSEIAVSLVTCDGRLSGLLVAGGKFGSDPDISSFDSQLIAAAAEFVGTFLHGASMYLKQQNTFLGTIQALSAAIDAKDGYTRGHSERVALVGHNLALAHGMTPDEAERVRLAGLLHDIGKIGVPESVLLKPGPLTLDEFEMVMQHPQIGHQILEDIEPLHDILPGVLHHHERWDGAGYPDGLAGADIPLQARILAVADMFDAMSSNRSYRSAMTREQVLAEIARTAGSQVDPELAPLFVKMSFDDYDAMIDEQRQHLRSEAA